jgi:hypothetical protein
MKRPVGLHCTICKHPARPQIAIATGLSKRTIAQRFSVSPDAVWRHGQAHLTPEVRAALATKLVQRDGDMRRILLEEGAGVVEALKAIRGPLFGSIPHRDRTASLRLALCTCRVSFGHPGAASPVRRRCSSCHSSEPRA